MSVAHHHAEWLSLVEVSGPFLAMSILARVFPQGLDELPQGLRQRLHVAHEEWIDNQHGLRPDPAIHAAWIRYLLREALGYDERDLAQGQALPASLAVTLAEHHETLRPAYAVLEPASAGSLDPAARSTPPTPPATTVPPGAPRLLIDILPPGQDLDKVIPGKAWMASPATRMMTLLHGASGASPGQAQTGARLGLVTNGHHWMLVHAVPNETTTYASFYSHLFFEEPLTLRALTSLLGLRRLFGVAPPDTLEALFAESAQDQHEVTDQLGLQVRRAVEVLVQAIDRIDRDRGRALLRGLDEATLYQAAVTVMMRLVFLFAAEERGMLLLGSELYDRHYAVSTLRDQLQEAADKQGEEVLERRYDAFCRLLATFRAVHAGIRHEDLTLPAYGGSLFDPDRYPFLEGRLPGTSFRDPKEASVLPLPIDDRTVLHLLRSLQLLEMRAGGGRTEARRLSFRALGVEQIGHVYEGLLDHTARRAKGMVLSLEGRNEPELALEDLESRRKTGSDALTAYLAEETGRSEKAVARALEYRLPPDETRRFLVACENLEPLYRRVEPFAGLVRRDGTGRPVLIHDGGVYVTEGAERRATGTHYTPPTLTEPIVQHTLDPLVYEGPAEGLPKEQWKLRTPREILRLRVCDLAMGSGAFLVQACRYLSERLVEAWAAAEKAAGGKLVITPEGELSKGDIGERALATEAEERLTLARRYVADRCLYGVDKNPMAVEIAKLSLWLVTLQKDRPFTFLDHAILSGDSLLGLTSVAQLERFHLDPTAATTMPIGAHVFRKALEKAREARRQLERFSVESLRDAEEKARLLRRANAATEDIKVVADLIVGAALATAGKKASAFEAELRELGPLVSAAFDENVAAEVRAGWLVRLRERSEARLAGRRPFHWVLEMPEVFVGEDSEEKGRGFEAIVGNPPFQGGKLISGALGTDYREFLVQHLAGNAKGHADLAAYFFLRAGTLLSKGGGMGLVATNTIAQGDTREVGLDQLVDGGLTIPRAVASRPWPGEASLEVSYVWMRNGEWSAQCVLDERPIGCITAFLTSANEVAGRPYRLSANTDKSFIGSYVLGMSFVLTREAAGFLITKDEKNRDVLQPYLNGEDLNSRPDQTPSRWVINFKDWSEDRAQTYIEPWRIIEEGVRPERQRKRPDGKYALRSPLPQKYWQYADKRPALYRTIADVERIVAVSLVNNHLGFAFVPSTYVFAHKLAILPVDCGSFAALQSNMHYHWAWHYCSTMRVDINYSPSDAFETFPFPPSTASLDPIGERYHEHRRQIMLARQEGLTKTYNRFHKPDERAPDIQTLRELHLEMDQAVAAAYGWSDLALDHGFHTTKQGLRFTISEPARREVLDRLLRLNHQRYAEEVEAGLHEKAKKPKTPKSPPRAPAAAPRAPTPAAGPTPTQAAAVAPFFDMPLFAGATAPAPKPGPTPAQAAAVAPFFDMPLFADAAASAPKPGPTASAKPAPAPRPAETAPAPAALEPAAARVIAFLRQAYGPQGKATILEGASLAEEAWKGAIDALKASGLIEQVGERRGAKYQLTARGREPA